MLDRADGESFGTRVRLGGSNSNRQPGKAAMTIPLFALPYAPDALAPDISAETLELHHGAHHKGYVDKTNKAIEGTPLADASLEEIVRAASVSGDNKLFNQAAQAWNHGFYWMSLSPSEAGPDKALAAAIEASFGSHDGLARELAKQGEAHFASGWLWLVSKGDALEVTTTHDAATELNGAGNPLLTIDLWEHAHYLDYRNERPRYLKEVIARRLNWDFASENLARGSAWTYPTG
jgi:superoxide dismutase, Fe-Mn family